MSECHEICFKCIIVVKKSFIIHQKFEGSIVRKAGIIILQIGVIHLFLFAAIGLKKWLSIPLPETIIGLVLLFLALHFKIVKLEWVEQGGRWLMVELLLFFIPSTVGIVNYQELLSLDGVWILITIFISTMTVIGVTGLIVQRFEVSE